MKGSDEFEVDGDADQDFAWLERLSDAEKTELDELLYVIKNEVWEPLPGPQTAALESPADITGYGGAAGGGKTDLAIGLSLTQHQKIGFFRQTAPELTAVVDRIEQILDTREGYNGSEKIWRIQRHDGTKVQIEFGSFPNPGDENKYRGRPHDLLVFDEATDMRKSAPEFLLGWLRTTDPDQRCRALFTFNPPTTVEGRWVIEFFAPWLDKKHPNPAQPGELRWFAMAKSKEIEVPDSSPIEVDGETIHPSSRTFIPSRVSDNPHLMGTGYWRRLQSMPEPLRSQLLYGDFQAGIEDDAFQVIPTAWVEAAMARWEEKHARPVMDSVGVDVAMRGRDNTVIICRHGHWFSQPIVHKGVDCIDGPTVAGFITARVRDEAVVHLDLFGVGAEPYGHLKAIGGIQTIGVNVGDKTGSTDLSGHLVFQNLRTQLWWRMREALDPQQAEQTGIALPPDRRLLADLCMPKWKRVGNMISVEPSEHIKERLGRSPDYGSACVLALMDTPKWKWAKGLGDQQKRQDWDPYAEGSQDWDPYGGDDFR